MSHRLAQGALRGELSAEGLAEQVAPFARERGFRWGPLAGGQWRVTKDGWMSDSTLAHVIFNSAIRFFPRSPRLLPAPGPSRGGAH